MGFRVLLATIRDKGYCPCPRCIILKSEFSEVGRWNDIKARVSQARTYMQDKILAARDAIYRLGALIKGVTVERLLKDCSLVPTLVSLCGVLEDSKTYTSKECIHRTPVAPWFRVIPDYCRQLYARV